MMENPGEVTMGKINGTIDVLNEDPEGMPLVDNPVEASYRETIDKKSSVVEPFSIRGWLKKKQNRTMVFRGSVLIMAVYLLTTSPNANDISYANVSQVQKHPEGPQVAWLMAFPNSGTTYTEKLIHSVSNRVLATNYGHEHFNEKGEEERISLSEPLFDGEVGMNGPFRLSKKQVPKNGYVLTKTHCAGYCFSDCPPNWYIYSADKYLSECTRGARYIPSENGPEEQIWVQYDPKIVKKAVHLYRNPFDNIVGRFHHERRTNVVQGNHAWVEQYPDNEAGFKAWCRDGDQRFAPIVAFNSERTTFDNSFLDLATKAPCYAEIIKYAQWHNNAAAASESLGIPTLNLHIEDFGKDFDGTLENVLNFVELPKLGNTIPYQFNSYDSYFSKDERTRMASFLKYLSSVHTWDELSRYTKDLNLHDVQSNHAIADINEGNLETPHTPVAIPDPSGNAPVNPFAANVPIQGDAPNNDVPKNFALDNGSPKSVAMGPQNQDVEKRTVQLPKDPVNKPQIAWLMSFPNSGTTFTEKLVQAVTDATVATNYGHEFVNENLEEERLSDSLPVFSGKLKLNGPFRLSAKPLPDGGFLLTKTHCGGYCFSDCPPNWYIYTPDMFLNECLKGARYSTEDGHDGSEQIWVQYDQEIVKKAVHLFRDPFDNVVSRFNHEHKTNKNQKNEEWLASYPRNEEGFKKWCSDAGTRYSPSDTFHSEMTNFDRKFLDVVDRVPCFAEFIKYTQWHNNAFAVAKTMGIPTLVVHYEDYRDNFDQTLGNLLDFVKLPPKGEAPKFGMAPYLTYFTDEERVRVKGFLEYLSTPITWDELSRYFEDNTPPEPPKLGPDGRKLPEVAWLMSFPNSGTTYTEKLVQMVTKYTVATNYGHEYVNAHGIADRLDESVPAFEGNLDGPFKLTDAPLPDGGYILTKTHCGGYCFSDCPPNWYMLTSDKYLTECTRGARYSKKADGEGTEQIWTQYDPTTVKKAVHLIRDPFDNIIARFHHEFKINAREKNVNHPEFNDFSKGIDGFKAWCAYTNKKFTPRDAYHSEKTNFSEEFLTVVQDVPCYGEFIKYVQWHNNAFAIAKDLKIPGLVIKYEDYHYNFDGTLKKLLDFVEQPNNAEAPPYDWHPYEGYYTDEEMKKIAAFLRYLADDETKEVLNTAYLQNRGL